MVDISKTNNISKLVDDFCKDKLDEEYRRLCSDLIDDLLELDSEIFIRGKEEIWAASIIWSIGSINFLAHKSFDPYATLTDICKYFNTSTSTVGQKASKIRDWLDLDLFNDKYQREDSQISDLLGGLVVTTNGFIVPRNWLEEEEEDDEEYTDEDDDELPNNYIAILRCTTPIKKTDIYQVEYLFNLVLENDEKLQKTVLNEKRVLLIYFYGKSAKVLQLEKKLPGSKFTIEDIINQPI